MDDTDDWYGPDAATFGDRLAGARDAAGMTQVQLARRLGVKKSTLADWENDLSEPRANRLSMLAGLLNVSIMWLLTGEGEGMTTPSDDINQTRECREILADLAHVRADLRAGAARVARLETRLRRMFETQDEA